MRVSKLGYSYPLVMALSCAFAFCLTLRAQNPAQADDVVRTKTELVQTDVTVFDRRGNFVDSIREEQFKLSIDGQTRPISLMSRMTSDNRVDDQRSNSAAPLAPVTGVGAPTAPPAPGRVIFFFFDDVHLSTEALGRGRKALLRFIDQEMASGDQIAVVSTSGQIGFLQQLTDNPAVLRAAINRLGDKRTREGYIGRTQVTEYMASRIQDSRDSKLFTYLMESVKVEYALGAGARRGAHNNDSAGQAYRILKNRIDRIGAQAKADAAATLGVLRSLMESSAKLPGRKLVFLMSDGFIVDPRSSSAFDVLREVTHAAAQSGAVIYTMDTRGTFMNSSVDASFGGYVNMTSRDGGVSLGETTAPRQPLSVLAEETGGRAIFNSNSIDHAMKQAVSETSDYYVLAWRPEADNERTGRARIEITIDGRPDLRVRLRRNFLRTSTQVKKAADTDQAIAAKQTPEAQLLTALGSAYGVRTLPTSLAVGFVKNTGPSYLLNASMQIERSTLNLSGSTRNRAELDVIGAAIDDRGLIYTFKQVLTVVPQPQPEAQSSNVIWNQQLKVQPGLYQVRVAVRDRESGLTGSAMQWIEVPAIEQNRFSMSSLFLGERTTAGSEQAQGPQSVRVDVDHRFARTSVLRFQTYVYNASRANGGPDVLVQAKVLRGNRQVVSTPSNKIPPDVSNDPANLPYWTELALNELPPGRYTLEVVATDRGSNNTASQTIGFTID